MKYSEYLHEIEPFERADVEKYSSEERGEITTKYSDIDEFAEEVKKDSELTPKEKEDLLRRARKISDKFFPEEWYENPIPERFRHVNRRFNRR